MAAYAELFDVSVRHEFFGDAPCPAVEVVPTRQGAGIAKKAGMILRSRPDGISVLYDRAKIGVLLELAQRVETSAMAFRLVSKDPHFDNYTSPSPSRREASTAVGSGSAALGEGAPDQRPAPSERAVLVFDSRNARTDAEGFFRLSRGPDVSEVDFVRLDPDPPRPPPPLAAEGRGGPAKGGDRKTAAEPPTQATAAVDPLAAVLTALDRRVPPTGFVIIALDEVAGLAERCRQRSGGGISDCPELPRRYRLHFQTRRTIWKYYLLGGAARPEAFIEDQDGATRFEDCVPLELPGGREALVVRSKDEIALQHRYAHRFRLCATERGSKKILIRRLPVATAQCLAREVGDGDGNRTETIVSEIYING